MSLQDIMQEIYVEHGRLTAQIVLEKARDPEHPLHTHFMWDDSIAAERYRVQQARYLIRTVRVVYRPATQRSGPASVRAYHSVPEPEGRTFRPVQEVVEDPLMLKLVLAEMERDWKQLKQRYGHLVQFAEMLQRELEAGAA